MAQVLFPSLEEQKPFDNEAYARLLRIYSTKKPEKVWAALGHDA